MLLLEIFVYFLLVALIIYDLFILQYLYCAMFTKQPPFVRTVKKEQGILIKEICSRYKNAKYICEIGAGLGGFARNIARNVPSAKVVGIENMFLNILCAKALDFFIGPKNYQTVYADAFDYLEKTNIKFDVAVAYLSPDFIDKLMLYKEKFNVLISVDFYASGVKPSKVIEVGNGYTKYNKKKYPHRLYIYKF